MKNSSNTTYGNLEQVYIILTEECNLSCPYCIREFDTNSKKFISLEEIIFTFKKLSRYHNQFQIVLSGGEPTLHPDFTTIIKEAKERFPLVSIASNGTNIDFFKNSISKLNGIHIQISIDGSKKIHNKLRGSNSFEKSIESILLLTKNNLDLTVASTANKDNIGSFKELFLFLKKIGVKKWKISQEIQTDKSDYRKDKIIGAIEWNNFVKEIQKYTQCWDGQLNVKTLFNFVDKKIPWDDIDEDFIKNTGCQPGIKKLYVYPDLSVIGCPCLHSFPLGNLESDDLMEVIFNKAIELNDYIMCKQDSVCSTCIYFILCKGGCPGASLREFGVINKSDPRCPLILQ